MRRRRANLAAAAQKFPKAKKYVDFRKMLEEMEKPIDAVMVSTPDHTHAPASVMAMRMGKHCYCEKPLTHTVYEARVLAQLAKEKKLATQMGTQIHAGDNYRRVVELVQAGAIGPVTEVLRVVRQELRRRHAAAGNARSSQEPPLGPLARPGPVPALPSVLPAGQVAPLVGLRQRHAGRHRLPHMDLPFWALGAAASDHDRGRRPAGRSGRLRRESLIVRYEFPARGNCRPSSSLVRRRQVAQPGIPPATRSRRRPGRAVRRHGRDVAGRLRHPQALPEEKFKDFKAPPPTIPNRSATTRNGSRPARPAARPPATSTTPGR